MEPGTWTTIYEHSLLDTGGVLFQLAGVSVCLVVLSVAPAALFARKLPNARWDAKQIRMSVGAVVVSLGIASVGSFLVYDAFRGLFSDSRAYEGTAWSKRSGWDEDHQCYYVEADGETFDVGRAAYDALEPGQRIRLVHRDKYPVSLSAWRPLPQVESPATSPAPPAASAAP
jgi:hypothetical protein